MDSASFRDRLARVPPEARRALLIDFVLDLMVEFSPVLSADDVHARVGFVDVGFDSLMAVDFKDLLEERLGIALSTTLVFDCPTPEALADYLLTLVAPGAQPAEPASAAHEERDPESLSTDELRALARSQRERLDAIERARVEPIAVVGMACRFPGGAATPAAFRELLLAGVDAVREVPRERWDAAAFYDPDPSAPGKATTKSGAFLDGVDLFDAAFFGISPREAAQLDPQQRILLEVAWETFEHACTAPERFYGSDTGVFVGTIGSEYFDSQCARTPLDVTSYRPTGNALSTAAGRISYTLGLTGPCIALDTACSSSLVAVHYAVQALRSGECSAALAGGVNVVLDPLTFVALSKASMLAPDGRCKTFAASANGYGRAEACGLVLLETLSRARAQGHRILALIRGTAINQDGASGGLTVPSGTAQEAVIRRALAAAGVDPALVGYVEAHGTGTSLGDPIEVAALDRVFGPTHGPGRRLVVGSVKTNIGHAEPAAGVAGLFKLIDCVRTGEIPPHLLEGERNPHIAWDDVCIDVPLQRVPWPAAFAPRVGGVSSFGFSGTNAHVVVEEPPADHVAGTSGASEPRAHELVPLSAASEPALRALAAAWRAHLEACPDEPLGDLAWCAGAGRSPLAHRAAFVVSDTGELAAALGAFAAGEGGTGAKLSGRAGARPPKVAFLFTGQGAQRPGMGRALYASDATFRATLERCAAVADELLERPLLEVLWGAHTDLLDRTDLTQPALFALEIALGQMWSAWGVRPTHVLGHSVGEYAAACLAGVFSLEDGMRLIAARGRLMKELCETGSMLACFASIETLEPLAAERADELAVAAHNGPELVVVSGTDRAIDEVAAALEARGVRTERLSVSHAFHSPLMEPMLAAFAVVARAVAYGRPKIELVSCLDPGVDGESVASADYWIRHVRAPVRFFEGARALDALGADALVEVGPAPTLLGMARRFLPERGAAAIATLRPGRPDDAQALSALGELWVRGAHVDQDAVHAGRARTRRTLPTYPFQRERYWIEPASDWTNGGGAWTFRAGASRALHPLLGRRVHGALFDGDALVFESRLSARSPAFLADHRVYDHAIAPAAAFFEHALAAGRAVLGTDALELTSASIAAPLVLGEAELAVQLVLRATESGGSLASAGASVYGSGGSAFRFELYARRADEDEDESAGASGAGWTLHASGTVAARGDVDRGGAAPAGAATLDGLQARCLEEVAVEDVYAAYAELGLEYGPAFRAVRALWRGDGEVLARVELPAGVDASDAWILHPVLLDACFQSAGDLLFQTGRRETHLPVGVGRVAVESRPPRAGGGGRRATAVWCHARHGDASAGSKMVALDVTILDDEGRTLATVEQLQLVRASRSSLLRGDDGTDALLYEVAWRAQPAPPRASAENVAGTWIVIADSSGLGHALGDRLEERGGRALVAAPDELDARDPAAFRALLDRLAGLPACRGVISLRALDGDLEDACASALHALQALAAAALPHPPRVWFVTRGARAAGDARTATAPEQGALWGLAGTAALEHPEWSCARVDLDPREKDRVAEVERLAAEVCGASDETQIAWRGDERLVARLARCQAGRPGRRLEVPEDASYELRVSSYGVLENLELVPLARRAPGPGEVEVEVGAAALNFKDVLHALGMLREHSERAGILRATDQPLGFEAAGTVVAVGAGVEHVAVGDEVLVSRPGSMATHVTAPAGAVSPKPAGLSLVEAAAVQTVFCTALYSLEHLAKIRKGERILIHACAGGVGQAALQIAQRAGAEVFATASKPKHDFLRAQGVEHVMDSRSLDFADEIMRLTGGAGVDVVLNSLAGEFIPRSLRVLAGGGRFVEIGKLGVWDGAQMAAERPDVDYFVFDLADVLAEDDELLERLLGEVRDGFVRGDLRALPVTEFPIERAVDAFTFLAQAKNVGKVVLSVPPVGADAAEAHGPVRPDRSYLVTGGLGALGQLVARWLASQGAGHVVLAGRHLPAEPAPTNGAPAAEDALAVTLAVTRAAFVASGSMLHVRACDVSQRADVEALLDWMRGELAPLGGIVHAAGVLDDGLLENQDWERFRAVLAPKVEGGRHLDALTRGDELDFFVSFSSIASLMGSRGQTSYAAANAYLDSLAHHRRGRGDRALAIDWGPWSGAGMAAAIASRNQVRFAEMGLSALAPDQGVRALTRLVAHPPDTAQVGVLPVQWSKYLRLFGAGAPPFYEAFADQVERAQRERFDVLERLGDAPPAERRALLEDFLAEQLAKVMGYASAAQIDRQQSFADLGIDSLLAVDLRNRLETALSFALPATLLFDHPTLEELALHLESQLDAGPAPAAAPTTSGADLLAELEELSDEEAERLLSLGESEE